MNSDDEDEEEEVTFLLRLRPTPSPPASRRRKSSVCSSRRASGSAWDVVIERQGGTSPPPCVPPQRRESVGFRPASGTAWDIASQPSVAPSAPPSTEVLNPWVCPTPQHAWTPQYGALFPNVSWTQPFAGASQHGLDYRHLDSSTCIPQGLSLQDYRHHFETPSMYFDPLLVETTNCKLPPVHPQQQNLPYVYHCHSDASKDLSQPLTSPDLGNDRTGSPLHKKSYSADNGNLRETHSNLPSLRSISLSHGNLFATDNQNTSSSDYSSPRKQGSVVANNEIRLSTPKAPNRNEQVSTNSPNGRFVNSFRRYSLPPGTFTRGLSMDQLQRCELPEEQNQESNEYKVETKPPAVPPRPPKPARFCQVERQRPQVKLQEAVTWVRRQIVILLYRLCAC